MIAIVGGSLFVVGAPTLAAPSGDETDSEDDHQEANHANQDRPPFQHFEKK